MLDCISILDFYLHDCEYFSNRFSVLGIVYDVPKEKLDYIEKCLLAIDEFLEWFDYLCGDDFCCIATVTSCNGLAPIDNRNYPKLIEWINRMESNEYYEAARMAEEAIAFKDFN